MRPPPLIVAGLVVALEALSLSALFPVTHEYAARLGGGPVWTGLLFALVALPKVLFNPIWGGLSDRFGRKPLRFAPRSARPRTPQDPKWLLHLARL